MTYSLLSWAIANNLEWILDKLVRETEEKESKQQKRNDLIALIKELKNTFPAKEIWVSLEEKKTLRGNTYKYSSLAFRATLRSLYWADGLDI